MSNFKKIYKRANASAKLKEKRGRVSFVLKRLLRNFHKACVTKPANLKKLKKCLVELLKFLATPEGKKPLNIWTTDLFVCLNDDWEADIAHLPVSYQKIIDDIGIGLHDTVSDIKIAEQMETTPALLLKKALLLKDR